MIVSVWSGGFALLTAAGLTGSVGGLAPVLGGLGLVGAAGLGMMAVNQCVGPFRCAASSGQCCNTLITTRGPVCPISC